MCNSCGGSRRPDRGPTSDPFMNKMATTPALAPNPLASNSAFDRITGSNMRYGNTSNNISNSAFKPKG